MTRWKNEHNPVPKTTLTARAWEKKKLAAGFSGGGLVTQNGAGDCVRSPAESSQSSGLSPIKENGDTNHAHTNGSLHYENGDDNFSNENDPSIAASGYGAVPNSRQSHRNSLALVKYDGGGSSALGALQSNAVALDFLRDPPQNNRAAIPLGPPPSSPVRGGNSSYLRPNETLTTVSSNWNHTLSGGTVVTNGTGSYRPPGDVGLTNLGNTCFMNSGLQCLIHTATLAEYFLKSLPPRSYNSGGVVPLMREFQLVMQQAWFGIIPVLNVADFRNKLGETHSQFKDGRQHDCQEFLALTLDTLHEQLKSKNAVTNGAKDSSLSVQHPSSSSSPSTISVEEQNGVSTNGTEDHGAEEEVPSKRRRQSLSSAAQMAENYWNKHMAENNTVIAKTFQGVYKSTVVCGKCKFPSVTYEPFMYLSLPIPRVLSKTIKVTFISLKEIQNSPVKVSVTINLDDHVEKLKELVGLQIPGFKNDSPSLENCLIFEVVNHNIARRIEDESQIKFLQDENRNVYMYELNDNFEQKYGASTNLAALSGICTTNIFCPQTTSKSSELSAQTYLDEDWDTDDPIPPLCEINEVSGTVDTGTPISADFIGPLPLPSSSSSTAEAVAAHVDVSSYSNETATEVSMSQEEPDGNGERDPRGHYIACIICLEDKLAVDLRKHKSCGAAICLDCLPRAAAYFESSPDNTCGASNGDHLKCPTCCIPVPTTQFVTFWTDPNPLLNLTAILFRRNLDSNNNSVTNPPRYFGAPLIVRIPTTVTSEELHDFLSEINPFPALECKIVTVSNDGTRCGQCIFAENCDGCEIPKEGDVSLMPNTCIAFSYINITEEQIASIEPADMAIASLTFSSFTRNEPTIDIHDCLRSFSEVEHLDEQNPWNCPQCKKNQSATKTMTICRFPDFLIIYLKRFVFADNSSMKLNNKLRFPIHDLDMGPYIAPESAEKCQNMYDLYACVCHFGSAQAGHYTAYGKSPSTDVWHYFNDSTVDEKVPQESEYSSAYVLFYQRKGLVYDIPKRTAENMLHRPFPSLLPATSTSTASSSSSHRPVGCATPIVCRPHTSTSWTNGHDPQPDTSRIIEENTLEEMSLTVGHSVGNYPHASSTSRLAAVDENLPGGFMQEDGLETDDGFESDFDSTQPEITPKAKTETLTLFNETMDQSRSLEIDEA